MSEYDSYPNYPQTKTNINPDLNGLFDDWQKGTVLLVAYEGGAAQGHLQGIFNGIAVLSGPGAIIYVDNTAVTVPGPINIRVNEVQAVAFVAAS